MVWPFAEFKSMVKYSLFVDGNCKVFLNTLENGLTQDSIPAGAACRSCVPLVLLANAIPLPAQEL